MVDGFRRCLSEQVDVFRGSVAEPVPAVIHEVKAAKVPREAPSSRVDA
jgi:hypothetical protein